MANAQLLHRCLSAALTFALATALAACSEDDAAPSTPNGGSGGAAGSSGSSGNAGSSGRGGSSGNAGSAGTGGDGPVTCGTTTCQPTPLSPACCTAAGTGVAGDPLENVGRAPNQCGTDLGEYAAVIAGICLQLNQPGALDPSCPEVPSTTPGQAAAPGCCTDRGRCGALEQFLPLGCYYPPSGPGQPCGNRDGGSDGGNRDAGDGG
jgi:hypothetical protein